MALSDPDFLPVLQEPSAPVAEALESGDEPARGLDPVPLTSALPLPLLVPPLAPLDAVLRWALVFPFLLIEPFLALEPAAPEDPDRRFCTVRAYPLQAAVPEADGFVGLPRIVTVTRWIPNRLIWLSVPL